MLQIMQWVAVREFQRLQVRHATVQSSVRVGYTIIDALTFLQCSAIICHHFFYA